MAIWKPERRFLAFCRRCLGARVVVGGLYGNPMRFVWCVMIFAISGNSLGFRAVGVFGVDYCTFRNLECANLGVWCGCLYEYGETLGVFGRVGTF